MSDFTVQTLLTTLLIEVRDVLCPGTCRHKGEVERSGRMTLVFPYRGTYVRHVGDDEVVADASLALTVDETLLREIAPPALLRFREPRLRADRGPVHLFES